jgi:hypothetical protein
MYTRVVKPFSALWREFGRDIRPVGGRDLNEIQEEERLRTSSLVRTAIVGVLAVAALALLGELRARSEAAYLQQRVVIAPFDNRTGDPSLDTLGSIASARVARRLRPLRTIEVLPERAIARAGLLVSGSYYIFGDSLRFGVQITDARSGELKQYFAPPALPLTAAAYYLPRLGDSVSVAIARYFETSL